MRLGDAWLKIVMIPPATAPEVKTIATNKNPLPRNTVTKKRSSSSPTRSRSTAINHRKAMPEKGSRFKAREIAFACLIKPDGPTPDWQERRCGQAGSSSSLEQKRQYPRRRRRVASSSVDGSGRLLRSFIPSEKGPPRSNMAMRFGEGQGEAVVRHPSLQTGRPDFPHQ